MEQKKAPLNLGLKMLENYKIVRHNEFRFISSEFGFVNSFIKMEPSSFRVRTAVSYKRRSYRTGQTRRCTCFY